ncbi:MAG: PilZ domain-containing protein [Armatimonadetes bacterium]|nr:PilZ domain-containing protein [Armatimonadota bacterium]
MTVFTPKMAEFEGTRARFQRLRDLKLFSGWVEKASNLELILLIDEPHPLVEQDQCNFQLFSEDSSAMVQGIVIKTVADMAKGKDGILFRLTSQPRRLPAQEAPRYLVRNLEGFVDDLAGHIPFTVLDVSKNGLGLVTDFELFPKDEIAIKLLSAFGEIIMKGSVRYVRKVPKTGRFRAGVQVQGAERTDVSLWRQVVQTRNGATDRAA